MSSKPIYPHIPYFYIIEHVASGKRYAGCRYAKGCNPVEFMQPNGYQTSSKKIKKIIEEEGLESFKIIEIKTIDEVGNVLSYETKFLVENDCAKSEQWLNKHNNTGMAFGTEEFKEKYRQTMLKNYAVEHSLQSEEVREKGRQTMMKEYGVEHALQSEEVKEKHRQTCLYRYGYEHPMQSEMVKEKHRQTCIKNYGVDNYSKTDEFEEKSRQTCLKNYSVENAMQSEEVKEKHRQTMLKNHGVEYPSQRKEHKERISQLNFERINLKINNEILNGDFGRFVYLYDNIEHVFLMGVEKSLNRGLKTKRYITISTKRRFKKYVDGLTGITYRIDLIKFSTAAVT